MGVFSFNVINKIPYSAAIPLCMHMWFQHLCFVALSMLFCISASEDETIEFSFVHNHMMYVLMVLYISLQLEQFLLTKYICTVYTMLRV